MTPSQQLAKLRETIRALRYRPSGGSYSRAARKGQALRYLEREAARLERAGRVAPETFEYPF